MDYHNFEEEIHALVLERGKKYFDRGAVRDLELQEDGWTAHVQGREMYRVILNGRSTLEDWLCDCPDAHGPVCKHVAATLYAVREQAAAEVQEMIEALSPEAVRELLRSLVRTSPELRMQIKTRLMDLSGEEE